MGVQPGAGCRTAERDLAEPRQSVPHAGNGLAHLRPVARELLAERHRHRVHQVRPAGLDDVVELARLRLERHRETLERRQQVVRGLVERGEMHGRWKDVVRGLAHVDVVVRVNVVPGERRDHLVRIHVRRGPGSGLEDVDRKLVVELARRHTVAGLGDALRLVLVEESELGVHACGGGLDPAEPASDRGRNRLARDREVGDRLAGLVAPELLSLRRVAHGGESSEADRTGSAPGRAPG